MIYSTVWAKTKAPKGTHTVFYVPNRVSPNTYLVPFWGEGGRLLKSLLASATVRNRLATVSQSSFLLARRRHKQVWVRLGEAACQFQVPGRAHPDGRPCPGPWVPVLLVHSRINRFWVTVCQDGSHAGTARWRRSCCYFLFYFGRFSRFWLALVGWQNTWKPEGLVAAVEDGRGSVQEAGELLWDTCSLILAELGVI